MQPKGGRDRARQTADEIVHGIAGSANQEELGTGGKRANKTTSEIRPLSSRE